MVKTIIFVTFITILIVMANCTEPQVEKESDETRAVKAAVKVEIEK